MVKFCPPPTNCQKKEHYGATITFFNATRGFLTFSGVFERSRAVASYDEPCRHLIVRSGDAVVMSGVSRLFYHEVKEVLPGTSNLLKTGGRISLTGRQVKR